MNLSVTIRFKEIFTREAFRTWLVNDCGFSGDFLLFIEDEIYDFFVNSNVRYDTEEAFKRHFKITLKNMYKRYEREHMLLEKTYNVNPDELDLVNKQVNVMANNDNSEVVNPLDAVLTFVSAQTASKQVKNKLVAFYEAIDKVRNDVIDAFIDELRVHFIKVLEPFGYYFCDEEV